MRFPALALSIPCAPAKHLDKPGLVEPFLGDGETRQEAHKMLTEAVELWLESASAVEIRRRLRQGARVRALTLAHA